MKYRSMKFRIVGSTVPAVEEMITQSGGMAWMSDGISMMTDTNGGEGLFLTRITGPGKVILQTQNIKDFARSLSSMLPSRN